MYFEKKICMVGNQERGSACLKKYEKRSRLETYECLPGFQPSVRISWQFDKFEPVLKCDMKISEDDEMDLKKTKVKILYWS